MSCDECARAEVERPAVALCRCCSVGLYEEHLVEMRTPATKPLYTCLQREAGLVRASRHKVDARWVYYERDEARVAAAMAALGQAL